MVDIRSAHRRALVHAGLAIFFFAVACTVNGQPPAPSPDHPAKDTAADPAAEVLAFERNMEAAVVRGDTKFLAEICPRDFTFTHGDGWTTGGPPLRIENREQWLAVVAKVPYLSRNLDSVKVELHGDIAITYGRYRARYSAANPEQREFTVWFERVYARRNGRWQFLSHRTVHGPVYEGERSGAR